MKHAPVVQGKACLVLPRIQQEYANLIASSTSFSLQTLFNSEKVRLEDYCKEFAPHPQSSELRRIAETFGKEQRIWLPNAQHHISCALFLYPTAHFTRMLTMMKNLVIGFYLNDVMGRDLFQFLTPEQQQASRNMIRNMAGLNERLCIPADAHPIELANAAILREFRDNSPKEWFRKFIRIYCHHINITHTDGNTEAMGHVPGIDEYMVRRCHLGGVHHIIMWIEYSDAQFLNWDLLKVANIAQRLKRLHWVTAAFAGMSNDLFSFEKEVIDSGADSNLVAIIALNNPELSLEEAIMQASMIVRDLLIEFSELMNSINRDIEKAAATNAALAQQLNVHLSGIVRCVQAIWMWHVYSKRYKRPRSIWKETRLVEEMAMGGNQ
jgi:Terpene synthase family 2, C-terminal metal binding